MVPMCCFAEWGRGTQGQKMLWMKCRYSKSPVMFLLRLRGILPWKSAEAGSAPKFAVQSKAAGAVDSDLTAQHQLLVTGVPLLQWCIGYLLSLLWSAGICRLIKFEDRRVNIRAKSTPLSDSCCLRKRVEGWRVGLISFKSPVLPESF